jgi:hypothetical protein
MVLKLALSVQARYPGLGSMLLESLGVAFGQQVQTTGVWNGARTGAFVQEGAQIASLAAVKIERLNLQFFEDIFHGKRSLRAYIRPFLQRSGNRGRRIA